MMKKAILLVLSLCLLCAEANYEFQVRVHSFAHTNLRDWEGHVCDPFESPTRCEDVFRFCLQAFGTSQTSSFCFYGSYSTLGHPLTATSAIFQDGADIFAPGVDNPLIFRGSANTPWIQNFQFQVRIDDEDDPDSDDLIDRVFITRSNFPIGETFTTRQTYTGIYGNVRMDMSYRAICKENYYGPTCATFCAGRDDSSGHYECNDGGDRVCLEGWVDLPNNCLTPVCDPACFTNSQCTAPGVCSCVTGWSGENCTQCIPATGCDHGSCSAPGECLCETGYGGTLCDIDEDVCGHQSPCQNGGTCFNSGPDNHYCTCPPTFSGPNCDSDVDECASDPCLNGATCMNNHGATPTCLCPAGFTGEDCGTEIDECQSSPCQNGATCNDLLDDFTCSCPAGFTGVVCDVNIDDCHPDFCLHGGTCVDQVEGYTCDCLPSYTGTQCEDDLPPPCAVAGPCPAGTFCVEDIESNTFSCAPCQFGQESCDNIVIIDPDAQGGRNGTDPKPQPNAALIGGIIGGVVAALLLLCLVIAMVILCMRCCACCACITLKSDQDETYETIGAASQQNPLYLGTSTILSSRSGTLRSTATSTIPRYDGSNTDYVEFSNVVDGQAGLWSSRQHENPMYAMAQTAISNGTPLPPRPSSGGRPASPDHYERLPGDNSVKGVVASGKYDRLKPSGQPEMAQSGKYDSLSPVRAPPAIDNLYVVDREDGYKILPGNPRPCSPDTTKMTDELTDVPIPTTNFDPYD